MTVKYPLNCVTEASRLSFCYRLDELLRIRHNDMGQKYRSGLISKAEWNTFLANEFEPKSRAIHDGINTNRGAAEKSIYWTTGNIDTSIVKSIEVI